MNEPRAAADPAERLAILGGGNIGVAIARGLTRAGRFEPGAITLTRRHIDPLVDLRKQGYEVQSDNRSAIRRADVVVIAVGPGHLRGLLAEIGGEVDPDRHVIVSVVSGVSRAEIRSRLGEPVAVIRAMPNTAVAICESMTCLSAAGVPAGTLARVQSIFDAVGKTLLIDEEQMSPATALGACGVAFFLRAIRAASQGGIEVGFHSAEAIMIAAQTARGAASLLLTESDHPERAIDSVTTPQGCTISGLNEMEHRGFSSAMIKGIVTSAEKAARLYVKTEE